jgi:hypothetical protein
MRLEAFTLPEQLIAILGFQEATQFSDTPLQAARGHDFLAGFRYGVISSPIVQNQFIGNDSVPVLAVVPLGHDSESGMINFEPRHLAYKKVLAKELTAIRISVHNEVGSLLQYTSEKTHALVVTLHFKKINNEGHTEQQRWEWGF